MTPGRSSLEAIIKGCGIRLSSAQLDRLWAYHRMLRTANAELNLTRIHNFENMVLKHYVDSLLVLRFAELPSPLIDMGSGPGLPGIPLKIARPDTQMILAEPRGARAEFLEEVCGRLKLDGVEVLAGKVNSKLSRKVAGVITRAVASIPETLDRVANCLEAGGRMLFMKGPDCDAEIAEAARTHADRFRLVADHAYQIPGTSHDRRLVIYERLEVAAGDAVMGEGADPAATVRGVSITSESNPTFKLCRDLLGGRGIRKQGRALLSGARPIAEVLERFRGQAEGWLTDSQGAPPPTADLPWYRLADPLFRVLDASGTHAPLLLVRLPEIPEWSDEAPWPAGCTLFVPFQDPENVGAVIRSAAAFGVARVVLLREAAHPFHPKAARAAGPALFQVPLLEGPSIQDLTSDRVPLVALATDGPELGAAPFPESFGLVPGVEGPGLPSHFREGERRRIAMAPGVESLNAATATAVALYAWRQCCPGSPPEGFTEI
ncbi:16S rRNA (guanine(527)-N(7))-methyltransferase GidB [Singulisphaera acidiphila DSM 18658]|uniref:Ribosomal RNA small subunit methyltransferase G n=1 Tax=Singulisphaera acidiphila (strain ATCC BAA-1392 / DSM 18658 / VKM B-2454 / MOB10) TaxID=886293 RepID=L0DFI7_SINAD|nr:16S rRNA (guanine(527)-N(7))-methyltransferase GidB [Singulisphaera acidiphila DSM 18658]